MPTPYVRQLKLGPMDNFVYLVGPQDGPEVVVVDPAWDVPAIEAAVAQDGKRVVGAFVSHCHGDHINGLEELLSRHDVPVYAQAEEVAFSSDLRKRGGDALKPLRAGDAVPVGARTFHALHTPGHTPGSHCLLAEDALVSGDTVFINGCGRCDFPGGSPEDMYRSLSQVLAKVPDTARLYPGHDYADVPVAQMEAIRQKNPYFGFPDMASFVAFRMRPRR
ncbi:MBL fold metallo-hydrolase [Corallococcus exiguus]|uniref:MBL fold metallo-hydrolase n=1 Tax=Corallococcus TaxID=83461 RepID=UPI000ED46CA2|nr:MULTISPECIES: MBL fold metallo-hydrolase [Corallococcus]NNB87914.1 MBL fold metallo-hydrolase [Corallococcus exiguus]NNB94987.1 MBL fold metallo-hydrolase [Corallococcus exiguus]NNC05305.1 MBL fold metallo-hydrolase [Corallococcus exiguus]NPC48096.1 MBL fold metallo-hydrolase [Corallococcus exiguus]NPC71526.1 MBL fold metallo-hydrolase [Corallococcus exiguus]